MKNRLFFFFFFVTIQSVLFSQNTEIGLLVGASIYTGDIEVSPRNFLPQTRPAVGIFGRQHFSEKLAVRALFAIGGVTGDEKNILHQRSLKTEVLTSRVLSQNWLCYLNGDHLTSEMLISMLFWA